MHTAVSMASRSRILASYQYAVLISSSKQAVLLIVLIANKFFMISRFTGLFLVLTSFITSAVAQIEAPSGPYTSDDGRYTVTVKFADGNLTIVEPNKTSTYTPAGDDVYEFTNPVNGKHYKIQVEDERTLAAFGSTGKTNFYYTGNA